MASCGVRSGRHGGSLELDLAELEDVAQARPRPELELDEGQRIVHPAPKRATTEGSA